MILVITASRITGLQYHRQVIPFKTLGLPYETQTSVDGLDDAYFQKFKIISFLREMPEDVERFKKLGLKIHFDIDDYWVLPSHHQLCKGYKITKYAEATIKCLKLADFVTTTTDILAERIKPYNKEVYVLPNAINPNEEQWQINPVQVSHNRLRFGYIAGSHHNKDVEMLHPELVKLYRDASVKNQWQLLISGFNFTAKQDGSVEMNPYYRYVEQLFTSAFYDSKPISLLRPELEALLSRNKLCEFRDMDDPYMRLNGADAFNYGKSYNSIDVSLVPLIDTSFNHNKSQLKMIEAGFMKKACIVSDVLPYKLDFTGDNCLVSKDKEWTKNIKYLLQNRNKVVDLSESLFEYVNSKYHIDIVNVERKQIFERECE